MPRSSMPLVSVRFWEKIQCGLALVLMFGVLGGAGLAALRAAKPFSAPMQEREYVDTHDDPLPPGAVARLGTLRFRHSEPIIRIAIGTDGKSILSATRDAVYVWDLATGKVRRRLAEDKMGVTSFAVGSDGKILASGSCDGTIHLWDLATGRELRHFTAHKGYKPGQAERPYGAVVIGFTTDGQHIVSTGSENAIRLWDAVSGEKIREFGPFAAVGNVSLSPDGKTMAGVVKNGMTWELRLWEVATGRERKRKSQPGKQILSPVFSPDGKTLAVGIGEMDGKKPCGIQLWDADTWKEIRTLHGHKGWAWCTFSPDGKTLASSGADNTGRLWDVATGKEIGRIGAGTFAYFNQLLFCPDGRTLVSCTQGHHNLRFWDRASGKEIRSSGDAITPIDFLSFSPDGRLLAAGSRVHWVFRLWDVATRKTIRRLQHDLLAAMQFSPDGRQLASAAWTDGQVRIWQIADGKELRRIPIGKNDNSISMAWSGDGKLLATWSRKDRLIHLRNPDTGKQVRVLNTGLDSIESLVFSPDSKVLAALGKESGPAGQTFLLLWAMDTGRVLHSFKMPISEPPFRYPSSSHGLAFSPDGRTLAVGSQRAEASIYVWELASGRLRCTLKHGEDVACLAFSPDGKLLAAANNINNYRNSPLGPGTRDLKVPLPHVHLWDLAAEKETQILKGHQGVISALAFSPDGKLLATGSYDTTVLLWDATRFKTRQPAEAQLRPGRLESLWSDLAGTDAIKAYRAIRTLAAEPKASVAFLKRHLHPVATMDAKQVARLLADLDNDQFAVREKAMKELEKFGDSIATQLHKALQGKPTLEVKRRIEHLLEKQNVAEHLRMVRALETLEKMATPEARELCAALAAGAADARLTREARNTLQRMARLPGAGK